MKAMSINEMREIEGGVWVVPYAKAVALARLAYEHRKVGYCYTRYYGWGLTCPVCGKYTK